jgi:uncharacterized membrane protein
VPRTRAWLRRTIVSASVGWSAALPAAALAASRPHPAAAAYLFALAVYAVGSLLCHQRPERSFFLWGRQLPVCARCTGIYLGAAAAALVCAAHRPVRAPGRAALALAALPTAATLAFEWTTGVMPAHWIRAATGALAGAAVAWLVVYEVN